MFVRTHAAMEPTRNRGPVCGWVSICAVLALTVGPDVRAAPLYYDGPVPFFLQRPAMTLFYSRELEDETRSGPTAGRDQDLTSDRITLDFRMSGWVYHPALVTFNLAIRPEFIWRKAEISGRAVKKDKADFLGYVVDTTWLRDKPYTIKLKSHRDRRDSSSSLAADVTTESSGDSVSLLFKNAVLPTALTYSTSETITDGFFLTEFSQSRWELDSKNKTKNSDTKLRIANMVQDRLIRDSEIASDRFWVSLTNSYRLKSGGRLNTVANFVDFESGEQSSNKNTSVRSQLDIPHRDNLHSYYSVSLNENEIQDYSSRSAALQAGLRHRLYENLTTAVSANGGNTAFADGDISNYGGSLNFAYTRRIGWNGVLSLNLGATEQIHDNQTLANFVQMRDESSTFDGIATTIILNNINIDPDSIELTDSAGLITYVRGIDYQVESVGNSTVIVRDPFAGIGDDATVLVSYLYTADPPAKTGLSGSSYGAQLLFWDKKFRIYYQGNRLKERLISGVPPPQLRYDKTERFGMQLNFRWSLTSVEIEDRDSTLTPLRQQTLRQNFNFNPRPGLSLTVGGQLSTTELKDTGEKITARGINAGIGWRVGPRGGQLRASAYFRENRDTEEQGLKLNYRWRFGAWYPLIRLEYANQFNGFSDETRKVELVYLEIKRRFR